MMKANILLVDDELAICKSCERILKRDGHQVKYVLSGREALELIKQQSFDVVFTDLKMMDIGGMEVLKEIKEHQPDVVVVIITGYATVAAAVETMKLGAFDFLPKPFTPEELLTVCRKAVEKREYILKNKELAQRIQQPDASPQYGLAEIIGNSPKMQEVFTLIKKVAPTNSTVLIIGESGTGKELVARAIHQLSNRSDKPFIAVDSATLSSNLLESELFGHIRGAFTGAVTDKPGLLEAADKGTIFLDEIGNISLEIQSKLLRVLQERIFLPVGGTTPKKVDLRFIFATNQDLKQMVNEGKFRDDLYYRLYVFPLQLPPLRERKEDIPLLAYHFLKKYATLARKQITGISDEAMRALIEHQWPGNVRQLEHIIERAVIITDGNTIELQHIVAAFSMGKSVNKIALPRTSSELKQLKKQVREQAVQELERQFILNALARNNWNVTRAALEVGMHRPNFQALMKKYNIRIRGQSDENENV
ncbi:MAG: sigma-54 dependent transcriptional regulator [Candidatus Sumerlaeia bacterium]|nr:sigma-54 dependent transcriptional regulator [Candidatus Sumerlaeia bacterium]